MARRTKTAAKKSAKKTARPAARKPGKKVARKAAPAKAAAPAKLSPALDAKARAISNLKFAKKLTDDLVKAFPSDKYTHQGCPTDNHVIWTMGHLAATYRWLVGLLGGETKDLPASYDELFGPKSKPVSDSSMYPAFDEVHGFYQDNYGRFLALAESQSTKTLAAPPAAESYGFAKDRLQAIERAAWHEGWHAGQISSLRRSLGLAGVMFS